MRHPLLLPHSKKFQIFEQSSQLEEAQLLRAALKNHILMLFLLTLFRILLQNCNSQPDKCLLLGQRPLADVCRQFLLKGSFKLLNLLLGFVRIFFPLQVG
jgi:hypothetical protein